MNCRSKAKGVSRKGKKEIGCIYAGLLLVLCLIGTWPERALAQLTCTITQVTNSTGGGNISPSINSNGTLIPFESSSNLTGENSDGNLEIFLFDTSTSRFTQITKSTEFANFSPSINSDGTRIAFQSRNNLTGENPDDNTEIFLFDTNTSRLRQITNSTGFNRFPKINSDGTRIAFFSTGDLVTGGNTDGNPEIFLFDIISSTFTQITNSTGGGNAFPSINSNGTRITFRSDRDLVTGGNTDGNLEIFLFDTSTSTFTQVTNTTVGNNVEPSINSDGTRIAFPSSSDLVTGGNTDGNGEIFLFDTNTRTFRQITNSTVGENLETSINSDGTRIAFASTGDLTGGNSDGSFEVFLFDTNTSTFTQITRSTGFGSDEPSINSDGTRIAFRSGNNLTGNNADGNDEIFLANCVPITGIVKVPIRWCGVQGSPSMRNPAVVGESSRNNVLLRRLTRVSDNIYIPQANMSVRSGTTARIPDFPVIPDPNRQIGMPGDVSLGSGFDLTEFQQLINNCKAAWEMRDRTVTGITAVHINRFVDGSGRPNGVFGLARLSTFSSTASQLSGGAMVIDNAYTLPTSTLPLILSDRFDKVLGHELGHRLTLDHGNGVNEDNDSELDEDDEERDERRRVNGPNLMQYQAEGITVTRAQSNRMRSQALIHIPDRVVDPVTPPLANASIDSLGDVATGGAFVDIDNFGVAIDQEEGGTTTFFSSTAGLLPENISNLKYFFFGDLDNNPNTGGLPADIGIPTTAQGIELIGQVQVDVINGSPQATPTVLIFQGGQFVAVTDPSIQATVLTETVGLLQDLDLPLLPDEVPISQNIQLEFRNDLVAPMSIDIVLGAMAENPNTGTIDNAEAALTFELPTFPSCQVTPAIVRSGDEVTVMASDLPPNVTAQVFLGPDPVATDSIDDSGNASISFAIPEDEDAAAGNRSVMVRAGDTAITADCSVAIVEIVNDKASFNPIESTFKTTSDTSGCPSGFVGKFSFDATLTNISEDSSLSNLLVEVAELTNGNLLQNADGGPGGVGARLTVPREGGFSDGVLSPDESVDVPFVICLRSRDRFSFFVDVLGIVQ